MYFTYTRVTDTEYPMPGVPARTMVRLLFFQHYRSCNYSIKTYSAPVTALIIKRFFSAKLIVATLSYFSTCRRKRC